MGLRVNKRYKASKSVSLNVSRKGVSTSLKVGNTSFNSRGRVTSSIPGTGISYSTNLNKSGNNSKNFQGNHQSGGVNFPKVGIFLAWVYIVVSFVFGFLGFSCIMADERMRSFGFFILMGAIVLNIASFKMLKKAKEANKARELENTTN